MSQKEVKRRKPGENPETQLQYLNQQVNRSIRNSFSPEIKDEALALYLYHQSVPEISKRLGVAVKTIEHWVKKGNWSRKRNEMAAKSFQKALEPWANAGAYGYRTAIQILNKNIQRLFAEDAQLDLDEMKKLGDLMGVLHKVSRLDEGKATEITEHKSLREMKMEVVRIMESDPFGEYSTVAPEKIDYVEVTSVGTSSEDSKAKRQVEPASGSAKSGKSNIQGQEEETVHPSGAEVRKDGTDNVYSVEDSANDG